MWSVLKLRPYLAESRFIDRTDHHVRSWILDLKKCTGRLARWRVCILEYGFSVVHRPGAYYQAADAMSQIPKMKYQEDDDSGDEAFPTMDISSENHRKNSPLLHVDDDPLPMPSEQKVMMAQTEDELCRNIRKMVCDEPSWFFNQQKPPCRRITVDGITQVVVLQSYRGAVLYKAHYPKLARHLGVRRIYDSLRRKLYCPRLPTDEYRKVSKYRPFGRHRLSEKHQQLLKLFPPLWPLAFIAIDILGPWMRTKQKNRFSIAIFDRFIKLTQAISVAKVTAPHVTAVVLEN